MTWLWVLGALAALSTFGYLHERSMRKQRGLLRRWPIRPVSLREVDPIFEETALGPSLATEVTMVGGASVVPITGATTDTEAWILAALSKRAKLLFEFGTCTGRTAYLWARNSPPDASIVTLTLRPSDVAAYHQETEDSSSATKIARSESRFEEFYYSGTPVEAKVTQLFGNSKDLDESPWVGQCDLVFIDGSHARSFVASDSRKALRLVRPGGLVLWHDYRGHKLKGVFHTLNQLARELPLVHIRGTSLVAYRRGG